MWRPSTKSLPNQHKGAAPNRLGVPLELKNSIGMKFLLIPPGEFQMGSAESHSETYSSPVHKVRITNPFYLGIYEVTQAEYKRVMGTNPSQFKEDAPHSCRLGCLIRDF